MSSIITDLPLHEVVLKILFFENMEKAAPMKPEDVLWRIDNPEISERQVREVLDWLVHQKKVELYLGKYSIDRLEFLTQKELYEVSLNESDNTSNSKDKVVAKKKVIKNPQKRTTFYINPPKGKHNKYQIYLLLLGVLALGYLTYTLLELDYTFESSEKLSQQKNTIINGIARQKRLYVSDDELYTESAKNAINYSFARQNTINKLNVKEFNRLQLVIDSISKSHTAEILTLQTELQTNMSHSNTFIKKLVCCNILVIGLFLFLYFKKH